ncbi:MAG: hypothetical protein H6726_28015 [Sandaracinaceae bacterium]|nr:hypothetical protein [Sandaracinaceae bacterium]
MRFPSARVSARWLAPIALVFALCGGRPRANAQDLVVDNMTITMHGVQRFDTVRVINGGRINVTPFDPMTPGSGNLELIADSILVDATSSILARGAGYQTARCGNGGGPGGGVGGCAVRDSGGGGAHFGRGGRGTKDCAAAGCTFPLHWEEDCGNSLNGAGLMCSTTSNCRNNDGLPSTAGIPFWHSIYEVEFGSAGGDKGCRDGDGFDTDPGVGGPGGGRIVLAAPNGTIDVQGSVRADGKRGCGIGNDSAGGGAGGTVMIAGMSVTIGANAVVSAAGGLGGDTRAGAMGQPDSQDCPAGSQTSGTCDDCGGGGGGGIVSVLSVTSNIASGATFDVSAALGGVCPICSGEAGGGAGELQINARYIGEFCDGFDNDFDGMVDEGLGTVSCGLGSCTTTMPACMSGTPTTCTPVVSGPDCEQPPVCNEPRIAVILDTSASMLQNLAGFATFGDGSLEHPGLDTDGNMQPDDSRMYLAKEALAQVISSYPEIDFALARYHQDTALDQSCQIAKWIECAGIFATYDNPTDNTGNVICNVNINGTTTVQVRETSTGEECINYAGSCGGPRRGADILAGFGSDTIDVVRWLDSRETAFDASETPGDFCAHSSGNDCEIRATGPTPLAGSLQAIQDYMLPLIATDPCTSCRGYSVILVTDGDESCNGNPPAEAALLQAAGVDVYVVAVSVLAEEQAALNAIAAAGGTTAATFVSNPADLVPTLTSIVGGSIRFESCNEADDDCDGVVDEGFVGLGAACNDGLIGACRGTGVIACRDDFGGTECDITSPGSMAGTEACGGGDEDCDGRIDEMLVCTGNCTPTGAEVCNGIDDDCNGLVDEADPALGTACGMDEGECRAGTLRCIAGMLECIGAQGPRMEVCNGLDEDCDGMNDNEAVCPPDTLCAEGGCRSRCLAEFGCAPGLECVELPEGGYCIPTACSVCTQAEACVNNVCVDRCADVMCDSNETCVRGTCRDCTTEGCATGELCVDAVCVTDLCALANCATGESCFNGDCRPSCDDRTCPVGQACDPTGACTDDPCADVSCDANQVCLGGSCRDDQCTDILCPTGNVCVPALGCITNPCVMVTCAAGRVCQVTDAGLAQCRVAGEVSPPPGGTNVLVSGNGGASGCVAMPGARGGGDAPPWPAWLPSVLLVGLALLRRRGAK